MRQSAIHFYADSAMILLFIYVAIALGVSFLCSVLEAVLLSVTPSYIAAEEERGHRNGRLWRRYKTDVDRPLAHRRGGWGRGTGHCAVWRSLFWTNFCGTHLINFICF